MADTKISALTELAAVDLVGADELPIVDTSTVTTKKVTVTTLDSRYVMDADVAAKGDLFVGTAADTVGVLSVGTNDDFLVADSAAATGTKWAGGATARTALGLGTGATATIANYLPLVAAGASVENIGAVESNVETESVTTTDTLDTSLYGVFDKTMTGNTTFTFSNPAPSGKATIFTLILRGAFTPTLPASVDWSGTAPTHTTPSMYVFTTVDAGTTWLGSQVGKAFA